MPSDNHARPWHVLETKQIKTVTITAVLSRSRQTHEFIIYEMWQRARSDNLTVCYHIKQMDVSFSCVCLVIDHEFHHNIVKVAVDP